MKDSYQTPACEAHHLSLNREMLLSSDYTWEDSIQGTGSSWGGLETDDSIETDDSMEIVYS